MDIDTLLETVKAKVSCSQCGSESEHPVSWLKNHDAYECPTCGEKTDLTTPEWKAKIQGYLDACTAFDD